MEGSWGCWDSEQVCSHSLLHVLCHTQSKVITLILHDSWLCRNNRTEMLILWNPVNWCTHFLVLSLMVKGQPSGSTSKAPGLPEAAGRQPYLQWTKSSPICSATAMLLTTTVSLELSTGHFSVETQVIGKTKILLYVENIAPTKSMKWHSAWRRNERGNELGTCIWSKINFKPLLPMASKFRNFK